MNAPFFQENLRKAGGSYASSNEVKLVKKVYEPNDTAGSSLHSLSIFYGSQTGTAKVSELVEKLFTIFALVFCVVFGRKNRERCYISWSNSINC